MAARRDIDLEVIASRHLEDNWLLDFDDQRLTTSDRALRIRLVGDHGWLTYKSPPREHSWLKVREEIEVALDDPRMMLPLLEAIGIRPFFRYQKIRTGFRVDLGPGRPLEAMFDETPMGNFLELEGESELVKAIIDRMGLDRRDLIQMSYPALWAERCRARGIPVGNMMFSQAELKDKQGIKCEP